MLVVVLLPGGGTPSLDDRTQDVAGRLRCPTCVAESTADSTSPMAESMRAEIRRQLAAGRSEDAVVAWFRARYGNDIVLAPQRRGFGWVLWAAPPAAGVAAVGGYLLVRRRHQQSGRRAADLGAEPAATLPLGRLAVVLIVAVGAAVAVPLLVVGGVSQDASATLSAPSATPSSSATPAMPSAEPSEGADPVTRAFALLRAGHAAAAEELVRPIAHRKGADRPLAMLVLGLAQRAEGEPAARRTLERFLHRYPQHPAAADVRRLLAGS